MALGVFIAAAHSVKQRKRAVCSVPQRDSSVLPICIVFEIVSIAHGSLCNLCMRFLLLVNHLASPDAMRALLIIRLFEHLDQACPGFDAHHCQLFKIFERKQAGAACRLSRRLADLLQHNHG